MSFLTGNAVCVICGRVAGDLIPGYDVPHGAVNYHQHPHWRDPVDEATSYDIGYRVGRGLIDRTILSLHDPNDAAYQLGLEDGEGDRDGIGRS